MTRSFQLFHATSTSSLVLFSMWSLVNQSHLSFGRRQLLCSENPNTPSALQTALFCKPSATRMAHWAHCTRVAWGIKRKKQSAMKRLLQLMEKVRVDGPSWTTKHRQHDQSWNFSRIWKSTIAMQILPHVTARRIVHISHASPCFYCCAIARLAPSLARNLRTICREQGSCGLRSLHQIYKDLQSWQWCTKLCGVCVWGNFVLTWLIASIFMEISRLSQIQESEFQQAWHVFPSRQWNRHAKEECNISFAL